jgi:hypothetical protein
VYEVAVAGVYEVAVARRSRQAGGEKRKKYKKITP